MSIVVDGKPEYVSVRLSHIQLPIAVGQGGGDGRLDTQDYRSGSLGTPNMLVDLWNDANALSIGTSYRLPLHCAHEANAIG